MFSSYDEFHFFTLCLFFKFFYRNPEATIQKNETLAPSRTQASLTYNVYENNYLGILHNSLCHLQKNVGFATLRRSFPRIQAEIDYTIPCAIIALATFMKPATLAPFT